jgi:hypothetical protein
VSKPRELAVSGKPLPNPRDITRALLTTDNQFEVFFTHLVAAFGQFIAHGISDTAMATGYYHYYYYYYYYYYY